MTRETKKKRGRITIYKRVILREGPNLKVTGVRKAHIKRGTIQIPGEGNFSIKKALVKGLSKEPVGGSGH